jgi:hypothetical protein
LARARRSRHQPAPGSQRHPGLALDEFLGYVEAGIGGYLLSKTINSPEHRLPSSFQFGSHIGAGVRLGEGTIGIALQHLSNAGLKQPNGGIDLILVQYTVSTGTPNK